jgi:hypothetical protein
LRLAGVSTDESLQITPVHQNSISSGHELTRRSLLAALGAGGAAAAVWAVAPGAGAVAAPAPRRSSHPDRAAHAAAPPVAGLHVQFGRDASHEMTVTWHTLEPVRRPQVLFARSGHRYERSVRATVASYVDAKSGETVYAHHARIRDLAPDRDYIYLAVHDGAAAEFGSFRTAPRGRRAFRFTSFGDQGTPTLGKVFVPPAGTTLPSPPYVNDNLGSPAAGDTTAGVERLAPLLHLFNGDLCYANLANDRVRTWSDFWNNNTRSARNRAWMPAAGNHENELGNGPIGYQAYQTYFDLPRSPGQTDVTAGLWYSFTVGSVRFISLNNDDVCLQDGGSSYVHGYSNGAQKAWLERELRAARADRDIDWIVVCMHQVVISTANQFNGADLGARQEWVPLFDKYGVDLVVCGHDHHYERSLAIRGQQNNETLTPILTSSSTDVVDTTRGTVHMVIGGGGTSAPSNTLLFTPPQCRVIVSVGAPDPTTGKRPPVYVMENAVWAGVRDEAHAYGFASFDVDPGDHPGDLTAITVTYYNIDGPYGQLAPFDSFRLQRPRSDGHHH